MIQCFFFSETYIVINGSVLAVCYTASVNSARLNVAIAETNTKMWKIMYKYLPFILCIGK